MVYLYHLIELDAQSPQETFEFREYNGLTPSPFPGLTPSKPNCLISIYHLPFSMTLKLELFRLVYNRIYEADGDAGKLLSVFNSKSFAKSIRIQIPGFPGYLQSQCEKLNSTTCFFPGDF